MPATSTCWAKKSAQERKSALDYDYLVIAPGPLLNFAGTPGLGPEGGFTHSICSMPHAVKTRDAYLAQCERMKKGEKVKIVIGTGHPGATCQGAAFEYIVNVHKDLVKKGLRDKADILWLSNEPALGDFGVNGVQIKRNGIVQKSDEFIKSVFNDHGIRYQVQTGVTKVEEGKIHWQNYEGEEGVTEFDFSMLIPQFKGQPFKYIGKDGSDVSSKMVNPMGFVLVDGKYGLPYPELVANSRSLARSISKSQLPKCLCGRHCLCTSRTDLQAVHQQEQPGHCPRPAAHRHGQRCDRARGGAEYRGLDHNGQDDSQRTHDRNGRGLHRLNGRFSLGWQRSYHRDAPRGARSQEISKRIRTRPVHLASRNGRKRRVDEVHAPLHVHLEIQSPAGLEVDPRIGG